MMCIHIKMLKTSMHTAVECELNCTIKAKDSLKQYFGCLKTFILFVKMQKRIL